MPQIIPIIEKEPEPIVTSDIVAPTVVESEADRQKKWLSEELMVEFYNLEEPGVPITFNYGKTKNIEKHMLMHGGKYKLRRELINHLESRQTPIWGYRPDGSGRMEKALEGYKSRFQCRQVFK